MADGPITAWTTEDKVLETLDRSKIYFEPAVCDQINALRSPLNIGFVVGTLAIWAVSQFLGVGEVVDVALLLVGAALIGPSIVNVVENLMEFGKCVNARSDADLGRSAKAFADAVVVGGLTAVMAILLRKGAKTAEARVPGVGPKSWLKVATPRPEPIGPDPFAGMVWSRVSETGTNSSRFGAGEGATTPFGQIVDFHRELTL